MTNCLFFGDSTTYGEYDGALGGWVDILKRFCHAQYITQHAQEVNIFNLGIGGETSAGLVKRFEVETQARKSPQQNLIFFLYGANDLAVVKGQQLVALTDFVANIKRSIELAKKYTEHIFLLSILPISSRIDGVIASYDKIRHNADINLFNHHLLSIATAENVQFIDLHSKFLPSCEDFISADGVHPNQHGYQFIAETIKPIVAQYL